MKAVLLAAGLGTRLRPFTDHVPKCLVPVRGKALLDIWLDHFTTAGVDEVLVNLHHLPGLVRDHLASRSGGPHVVASYEPTLLGSAGTLRAQRGWLAGEDMFLVVNGDNLTDFDLRRLVDAHRQGGSVATLTVFRTPRPRECGIVEVVDGWVTGFQEKPEEPRGDLANAGMYAFRPDVIDRVPPGVPRDIGFDLLPGLVGEARAVDIGAAYFLDVGTPEALARANREWEAVELG